MVKGISRQVIVVHSPDPKLFEQAIFILKEDAKDVTDEKLLKVADLVLRDSRRDSGRQGRWLWGAGGAAAGAAMMALAWLISGLPL